jgi:toxin YoeB
MRLRTCGGGCERTSERPRRLDLIEETLGDPFRGRGKPEALKFDLSGCWSRRIDLEHRLVYEVTEDRIRILSCRFHYR